MDYILLVVIIILSYLIGALTMPLLLFLRARRDDSWDNSNMANMLRLISHIATHPSDFGKMVYEGTDEKPFWYIKCDEFDEVVKSRPKKK